MSTSDCCLEISKMNGFLLPKILNITRWNIACCGGRGAGVIKRSRNIQWSRVSVVHVVCILGRVCAATMSTSLRRLRPTSVSIPRLISRQVRRQHVIRLGSESGRSSVCTIVIQRHICKCSILSYCHQHHRICPCDDALTVINPSSSTCCLCFFRVFVGSVDTQESRKTCFRELCQAFEDDVTETTGLFLRKSWRCWSYCDRGSRYS
jgi:hypothetical protein